MANLKFYLKEFTGGQRLNRKERAIFIWWALSLCIVMISAESIPFLVLAVANIALASKHLKRVPIAKLHSPIKK